MKCKQCQKEMILDDRDYRFKGNMDKYWICENCYSSCIEEIRFNQSFREHWTLRKERDNEASEKKITIKHNIEIKKAQK